MNKLIAEALLVVSVLILVPGCVWFGVEEKPAQEPMVKLRIVNVLDKKYFDDAHIKGASGVASINVPSTQLMKEAEKWDKAVPVITYCANPQCLASHSAAEELAKAGFDARVYTGGMAEWYQLSQKDPEFKVEGAAKEEYLTFPVKKLSKPVENVKEIDAQELQKMIKEVTIL